MLQITPHCHADVQRRRPLLSCSLCGGGLYRGDEYWKINGYILCGGCLLPFAREDYAPCRAVCGEEEGAR